MSNVRELVVNAARKLAEADEIRELAKVDEAYRDLLSLLQPKAEPSGEREDPLSDGCLDMIRETLEAMGTDMSKTPPMMYPEAIRHTVTRLTQREEVEAVGWVVEYWNEQCDQWARSSFGYTEDLATLKELSQTGGVKYRFLPRFADTSQGEKPEAVGYVTQEGLKKLANQLSCSLWREAISDDGVPLYTSPPASQDVEAMEKLRSLSDETFPGWVFEKDSNVAELAGWTLYQDGPTGDECHDDPASAILDCEADSDE